MNSIVAALLALSSNIDPQVKLVLQKPQSQGQWAQVVFNDYCYKSTGNSALTEKRTRAMADIFGQASAVLAKADPEGEMFSLRSYSKDQQGNPRPRLHIAIIPGADQSARGPAMDATRELSTALEQALELGFDVDSLKPGVSDVVNLAIVKRFVSKTLTEQAASEVRGSEGASEEAPI